MYQMKFYFSKIAPDLIILYPKKYTQLWHPDVWIALQQLSQLGRYTPLRKVPKDIDWLCYWMFASHAYIQASSVWLLEASRDLIKKVQKYLVPVN